MARLRPIGILGGMGPEATILLQRKLVEAVPAQDDSDHIPLIVDMNPQVPSRMAHLIDGTGRNPGPTLARMARGLERAGVAALAMPCNTAHYYAPEITNAVKIPFLSMIDLAVSHVTAALSRGARVGVLASPAVQRIRLFEAALAGTGIDVLWPQDPGAMLGAIKSIKAKGPCPESRTALRSASDRLVQAGAHLQLIACSEFSLISDSLAPQAQGVDTVDLLAQAIVAASRGPAS